MLITLGGKAGSGKSSISKKLAEKLGYEIISIGQMKRKLAAEMGLDIQSFNLLGEQPENAANFDLKYEEYQRALPLDAKIILDSRLGCYAQPQAFKVLLEVQDEVAAERIKGAQRETESTETLADMIKEVKERNKADEARYFKLYKIKVRDPAHYSLIIDTSDKTVNQIVEMIMQAFQRFLKQRHTS